MRLFSLLLSTTLLLSHARGQDVVLFSESFDDAISPSAAGTTADRVSHRGDALGGQGLHRVRVDEPATRRHGLVRRCGACSSRPTRSIIRFYLKLSKGWGWTRPELSSAPDRTS